MSRTRRYVLLATIAASIAFLYFYNLSGVGVLGPDEPRYAAVGRAMAQTGDLVTPRLWGTPWFEKPPLLYWMTAFGTALGLNPDLCGRVPVVCLSLLYLAASFFFVGRAFNPRVAAVSTALLGTSAWWLAFSGLCLTDLPLAVFFSLAVLLVLPLLRSVPNLAHLRVRLGAIGVCFGLAILAKGLVPLVLALPFLWYLRRYSKLWWVPALTCVAVALPWYWAVYAHNGFAFVQEFFIRHHLERVYSPSLLHVQPPYYYVPVFLAALFPWTPLLGLLGTAGQHWDARRRFLLSVVVFGLVFFSIPVNKLPGYVLPLLPSTFILVGSFFEFRSIRELSRAWLIPCAVLIACIPLLGSVLPQALALGRISASAFSQFGHQLNRTELFYILAPLLIASFARRSSAAALLVLCIIPEAIFLKAAAYPALDANVSARALWRTTAHLANETCDGGTNRDWMYGLSYYRGQAYPNCDGGQFKYVFRTRRRGMPDLDPVR